MKKTVDHQTMTNLIIHVFDMFGLKENVNNSPNFEIKDGFWIHENKHSITAITDDKELKSPEQCVDDTSLLGVYKIDPESKFDKFYLFQDSIKKLSKYYADYQSIIIVGQKTTDLRKTMGSFGGGTNGLFETEAYSQIEAICKLELLSYWIIHRLSNSQNKEWTSVFYNKENSVLIDKLVMQITKDAILEHSNLKECFEWLNINGVLLNSKFLFSSPIPLINTLKGTSESEWLIINSLDIFINCFPIEAKANNESWEVFLNRTKEKAQDCLIPLFREHRSGWETVNKYLTEENQTKYRGSIQAARYGIL